MNVEHSESLQICKATDRYIYVFRFFFFFRFLSPIALKPRKKKRKKRRMNRLRRRETQQFINAMEQWKRLGEKFCLARKRSWNSWKIGIELYPFLRQTLNADSGQWLCNMHPLARCFSFRRIVKRHSNQKTSQMFRGFKSGSSALRCSSLNEHRFVSTLPSGFVYVKASIFPKRN